MGCHIPHLTMHDKLNRKTFARSHSNLSDKMLIKNHNEEIKFISYVAVEYKGE